MTRCDIKILQRRLGGSNKRKILNRPDMTFALTTVKKVGVTFHNPTIHGIILESSSALCTVRNAQAGQLSASNFLCSSFDTLHASQAEKKYFNPKYYWKAVQFLDVYEARSLRHTECDGKGNCSAGAACGWLTEQPTYPYSSTAETGLGPAMAGVGVMGHHYSRVWIIKQG